MSAACSCSFLFFVDHHIGKTMFKKNIFIIVTLVSLFFAANISAQILPLIGPAENMGPVDVSTFGYQKGLVTDLYDMTGAQSFSASPRSNRPERSYVAGVPPFTANSTQGIRSDSGNSGNMATRWSGFIRTTIPGIYVFDLSATGLSATSRCLASIALDSGEKKQMKFTQDTSKSLSLKVNLATGMRPVSMWLHCDEGQSAGSAVKLELKRSTPGEGRGMVALTNDDFYSKMENNSF
jgi:hypothetical protein